MSTPPRTPPPTFEKKKKGHHKCFYCKEWIRKLVFKEHNGPCMYKVYAKEGAQSSLPCMYDCCQGEVPNHLPPNGTPTKNNNKGSQQQPINLLTTPSKFPTTTTTTPRKSTKRKADTDTPKQDEVFPEPTSLATPDMLQGKSCLVCGGTKNGNAMDYHMIHVGQWRVCVVCMKTEMTNPELRKIIEERIDHEARLVFETKDACPVYVKRNNSNHSAVFDLGAESTAPTTNNNNSSLTATLITTIITTIITTTTTATLPNHL
jgi:hypothetical protein